MEDDALKVAWKAFEKFLAGEFPDRAFDRTTKRDNSKLNSGLQRFNTVAKIP